MKAVWNLQAAYKNNNGFTFGLLPIYFMFDVSLQIIDEIVLDVDVGIILWWFASLSMQIGKATGKLKKFIVEPFVAHQQVCSSWYLSLLHIRRRRPKSPTVGLT